MEAIIAHMLHLVAQRVLRPGDRLPSVRRAAENHGVSKNTMAEAYDRMIAGGHLQARPGSGTYVAARMSPALPPPRPHVAEALDLVTLLREQLDQHYEVRPGDGRPPSSWMEGSELAPHFARLRPPRGQGVEYGYGSSWGYLPLREKICLALAERAVRCTPEQVLMTQGANHALDLIMRHLVEPDDVVFVDDPGYYPLFGKLRLGRARVVGVRRGPDGPDLADLEAKLLLHRARLFFTQSLAHNPTGGSLSLPVAHGLLQAADRHGFHLVEDDAFADILSPASPRLAALDQLDRVIYVGTFSKTLSAALRVGYVAAHPAIAAALADVKLLTVVATSHHLEKFVCGLIDGGHYMRHLRRLRGRVETATTGALADLERIGLHVTRPRDGGFYIWVALPEGTDEAALCREAAASSIFLAPGSVFSPTRDTGGPFIRANVAHASDPRFLAFLDGSLQRNGRARAGDPGRSW